MWDWLVDSRTWNTPLTHIRFRWYFSFLRVSSFFLKVLPQEVSLLTTITVKHARARGLGARGWPPYCLPATTIVGYSHMDLQLIHSPPPTQKYALASLTAFCKPKPFWSLPAKYYSPKAITITIAITIAIYEHQCYTFIDDRRRWYRQWLPIHYDFMKTRL